MITICTILSTIGSAVITVVVAIAVVAIVTHTTCTSIIPISNQHHITVESPHRLAYHRPPDVNIAFLIFHDLIQMKLQIRIAIWETVREVDDIVVV
jgi:hypothetical protein